MDYENNLTEPDLDILKSIAAVLEGEHQIILGFDHILSIRFCNLSKYSPICTPSTNA